QRQLDPGRKPAESLVKRRLPIKRARARSQHRPSRDRAAIKAKPRNLQPPLRRAAAQHLASECRSIGVRHEGCPPRALPARRLEGQKVFDCRRFMRPGELEFPATLESTLQTPPFLALLGVEQGREICARAAVERRSLAGVARRETQSAFRRDTPERLR